MPSGKKKIFLLVTGDELLRRNQIHAVLDKLLPDPLRTTNLHRIYPDDLNWDSVLEEAGTTSLLGGRQVFWISRIDVLKKGADWTPFETYCETTNADNIFIFEAESVGKSHALVKLAVKYGTYKHYGGRSADEGLAYLREKVRSAGKKLTPGAWQLLIDRLGGSPRLADLCIDQLVIYSNEDTIDESAVEALATEWLRYEPFDLTEAMVKKDVAESLKIFHYFNDLSDDLSSTMGLIHWQLKRLWQAKQMLSDGQRAQDVGKQLRIPPFRLNQFLSQAKRFEMTQVEQLLDELWRIDWQMKTGACDRQVAMETFLTGVN